MCFKSFFLSVELFNKILTASPLLVLDIRKPQGGYGLQLKIELNVIEKNVPFRVWAQFVFIKILPVLRKKTNKFRFFSQSTLCIGNWPNLRPSPIDSIPAIDFPTHQNLNRR